MYNIFVNINLKIWFYIQRCNKYILTTTCILWKTSHDNETILTNIEQRQVKRPDEYWLKRYQIEYLLVGYSLTVQTLTWQNVWNHPDQILLRAKILLLFIISISLHSFIGILTRILLIYTKITFVFPWFSSLKFYINSQLKLRNQSLNEIKRHMRWDRKVPAWNKDSLVHYKNSSKSVNLRKSILVNL
jgi:hypothetical protein